MKKKLKYSILAIVLLMCAVIAMWPYTLRKLIAMRLTSAIAQGGSAAPGFALTTSAIETSVNRALGAYDPPHAVFHVLWEFATSEEKLPNERLLASTTLQLVACNEWSLRRSSSIYAEEDWNKAFENLLQRQSISESKSSPIERDLLVELKKLRAGEVQSHPTTATGSRE